MLELAAVRSALYLFHMPSAVRQARGGALPEGMTVLLEIAAGEEPVATAAATQLERPPEILSEAAGFFIEQILMAPESDSYRVLGAHRDVSNVDLRRNMALLLRWAHPDADRQGGTRAAFANRITKSWENLKTQDRRESYDASHPVRSSRSRSSVSRRTGTARSGAKSIVHGGSPEERGFLRRALEFLFRGRS